MVCKEDVVSWFKELRGHKRIDVMCSLLNMCLPFELRFLGTCLEELGKRDFHDLREAETRANNVSELTDLQCISDKRTQRKLTLYLSLLQSSNHACSNGLYKILANLDFNDINLNMDSCEENPLDELLLLYTLAANHPAFTYEQKSVLVNILLKLQEEEEKVYASKQPVGIGLLYVKPQLQPCVPCPASEDRQDAISHCPGMTLPTPHPAEMVPFQIVQVNSIWQPCVRAANTEPKGRGTGGIPPGMAVPAGISVQPEQLGFVHLTTAFPSPVGSGTHHHQQPLPWPHTATVAPTPVLVCEMPVAAAPSPAEYPPSPLVSRQSSPSQSGSPSRAGSPAPQSIPPRPPTTDRVGGGGSGGAAGFKGPPGQRRPRTNCAPEPPPLQRSLSRKGSVEPPDGIWETLSKEMPGLVTNLKKYSPDELRRMSDDELKDLGLSAGAIAQLRSIVTKLSNTNGLSTPDKKDGQPSNNRKKQELVDNEVSADRKGIQQQQSVRRWEGAPVMYPPTPLVPAPPACYTCITVPMTSAARFQQQHHHQHHAPQMYCVAQGMRSLVLEDGHSRSGGSSGGASSDSSSNGHSPPDTPSVPNAPHWDRNYTVKDPGVAERWSPGCEDKDQRRPPLPDSDRSEIPETVLTSTGPVGGRRPGVMGRGKASNPPGLQTLPRGRGPSTVPNERGLPGARSQRSADVGSATNGGVPPQQQQQQPDSRKVFAVPTVTAADVAHVAPYPPSTSPQYHPNGTARVPEGPTNTVPYQAGTAAATTAGFVPAGHYAGLHGSGSVFPGFGSYSLRPTYPFSHNGELVYQYHGPQTTPPPPPHRTAFLPAPVIYSNVMPPPKLSCYNCGSQNHHATDCKEATMDEMTKQSQYRLDYAPYPKQTECSTEK